MAHAMALENPRIRADVVEAQEFPHLVATYQLRAVPKTVINGIVEVMGAVPEELFLRKVLTAVGREDLLQEGVPTAQEGASGGPTTMVSP